jgi:hypothetical protein
VMGGDVVKRGARGGDKEGGWRGGGKEGRGGKRLKRGEERERGEVEKRGGEVKGAGEEGRVVRQFGGMEVMSGWGGCREKVLKRVGLGGMLGGGRWKRGEGRGGVRDGWGWGRRDQVAKRGCEEDENKGAGRGVEVENRGGGKGRVMKRGQRVEGVVERRWRRGECREASWGGEGGGAKVVERSGKEGKENFSKSLG